MASSPIASPNSYFPKIEEVVSCPLSLEPIKMPVIVPCCGKTFEREQIVQALASNALCPLCREDLSSSELIPNRALKDLTDVVNTRPHSPHSIFMAILQYGNTMIEGAQYEEVLNQCDDQTIETFMYENMNEEFPAPVIKERFVTLFSGKISFQNKKRVTDIFNEVRSTKMYDRLERLETEKKALVCENKWLVAEKVALINRVDELSNLNTSKESQLQAKQDLLDRQEILIQRIQAVKLREDAVRQKERDIATGALAGSVGAVALGLFFIPVGVAEVILLAGGGGLAGAAIGNEANKHRKSVKA